MTRRSWRSRRRSTSTAPPSVEGELGWLDHDALKVARELAPGEEFRYTFDLGDDWRHRCRVEEKIDPHLLFEAGSLPRQPVAIWGWGWMPDQYGRVSLEE
jgi:hypothetical protein